MSDIDQLTISRILGSTVSPYSRASFGGFSAVKSVGEMLGRRPRRVVSLTPNFDRDSIIIESFEKTHQGYSVDRTLADPGLAARFVAMVRAHGVDATPVAISRRLLRLRKSGGFKVETTTKDERDLHPYLIAAELAFAQLTYQYDVSYDDLLADPKIGEAFDDLAAKIGRLKDATGYRLAALYLRKNVRSRGKADLKNLESLDVSKFADRWQTLGSLADVSMDRVPHTEGVFSLSEPSRYLYLTKFPDLQSGVRVFRDEGVLASIGNRFWTPSPERITLRVVKREDMAGVSLRLFELRALEEYHPIFNMLPNAA